MIKTFTFDDVLLVPKFSFIKSRKDIDLSQTFLDEKINIPLVSSNMDSVTGSDMAKAMLNQGAMGCLHRFNSIEENVNMFKSSFVPLENLTTLRPWVSIGLGGNELERAHALKHWGANVFIVDVANGANIEVVKQVQSLREILGNRVNIVVGNFATGQAIKDFIYHVGSDRVDAWKVGIGGGSACTTRKITGSGYPTFSSIRDCVNTGQHIIADGGIRNSGDFSKAIAAGAKMVMVGGMLAGCDESPSEKVLGEVIKESEGYRHSLHKKYRGSASAESYEVQGKTADHRTPEGESFLVPYTGPAADVVQQMSAGLRSSMSYVGAANLEEFRSEAEFIQITSNGSLETHAHGKKS